MIYAIIKNTDRYAGIDPKMPNVILSLGTLEEAELLASRLSNWNPGCDYAYYVVGKDN